MRPKELFDLPDFGETPIENSGKASFAVMAQSVYFCPPARDNIFLYRTRFGNPEYVVTALAGFFESPEEAVQKTDICRPSWAGTYFYMDPGRRFALPWAVILRPSRAISSSHQFPDARMQKTTFSIFGQPRRGHYIL